MLVFFHAVAKMIAGKPSNLDILAQTSNGVGEVRTEIATLAAAHGVVLPKPTPS